MSRSKQTSAGALGQKERENEQAIRFRKVDILADAVRIGIPWLALVLIFGCITAMVYRLAGKTTLAQIGVSFFGEMKMSNAVAYVFGAAGTGYGLFERNLRRRKTKNMAAHLADLESRIDPSRSSSGLTPKGTTRKGE